MAAFGGLVLTIKGRNLQAKVQAGQQLKFSRMGLGDGVITSQSIPNMTGLITERKSIAVNRVYTPSAGRAEVSAILSNQDITTGFFFRELGVFAIDPDEGEIMYAYGNSGSGSAEYIPPTGGADLIEKLINVNLLVGNATNISITTDQSLVYVTAQDLEETLQEAKEYTDTQIANVKVPDASLTQKGIVQLSEATNSTSNSMAATPKAVSLAISISEQYTDSHAAPKQHSHLASDLPSASTQTRGIVQLNTSTGSTATDQAATPSAVKAAYDRADQAFTQASDLKSKVANAITGKGGSANSGMTGDQLATAIRNLPVKRWAEGDFQSYDNHAAPNGGDLAALPAIATVTVNIPAPFLIGALYIYIYARVRNTSTSGGGYVTNDIGKGVLKAGTNGRGSGLLGYGGYVNGSLSGNTLTLTLGSTINAAWRKDYFYELGFWSAYE